SGIMKCCGVTLPSTRMTTSVRSATGVTLSPVTRGSAANMVSKSAMNAVIGLRSFPCRLQVQDFLPANSEITYGEHDPGAADVDDGRIADRVTPTQPVLLLCGIRHRHDALRRIIIIEDHVDLQIREERP